MTGHRATAGVVGHHTAAGGGMLPAATNAISLRLCLPACHEQKCLGAASIFNAR